MFSQFVCLCLLTSLLGLVSSQTNYVQNGDLSTPNISMTQAKISTPGGILGWTGTVVEIGFGRIYNSYWQPYLPVMNLDTGANQVVTQTITLISPSLYTLCFQWAPREEHVSSSLGSVSFNTNTNTLTPIDDSHHSSCFIFPGISGANTLKFTGLGMADGYGLGVSQISLWSNNIVMNGQFSYPTIPPGIILNIYPGGVLGWQGTTNVKLVNATSHNPNWSGGQVAQTVSDIPQAYSQVFPTTVVGTSYTLIFNYAARVGRIFNAQSMNVRWNGNILKTYTGTDAGVYMDNLKVTATGNDVLLFEGLTTQSGQTYGFAIKNVQLLVTS